MNVPKNVVILFLCLMASMKVFADDSFCIDGFVYSIMEDHRSVALASYKAQPETDYSCPLHVEASVVFEGKTYPVKKIDTRAFQNVTEVREIVIDEGIEDIGNYAFYGCTNLKSIFIPSSVMGIGEGLFGSCYNLTSVEVDPDNGRVTRKTTDSWGNITSISDAMGETVEYFYSSNGKPVMITSGDATVEMTYDIAGNQTSLMDPDAGTMTYAYAADGTLIRETDGRGIETVYAYDDLGRVVSAKTGDFVVFNVYGTSGPEKLQLVEQAAGENSVEFTHDIYGRVLTETRHIQGESPLEYSYEYNGQNLPSKVCYPGGLEVEYKYDRYGYTTQVKADGKEVYSLDSFDGLTTKSSFLGKLTLSTARDENWFENNVSILRDSTVLDALDESFDSLTGNLRSRARRGVSMEEFEYDDMDRLLTATKKNPNGLISNTSRVAYANNGNILSKSDLGEYEYDATFKPHAVVGISSAKPWLPTCTQTFAIHPIGRVQSISDDETHYHLDITYGPDLQRCKSVLTRRGGTVRKTVYGGAYENTVESGVSREFYYLDGNVIVVKTDGIFTPYLALTDNLGSYLAVVDSLGNKVFNAHYDAWGCQHDVTANSIKLHRGYCGHEMLNEFKLINMNARLYSPYVGRFLAPDNYVQAPDNTQSFNRYSYCLNNPLKYTDPSGNYAFIDDLIAAVVGGTVNVCSNLIAGEVKDFWHGLSLFGVGAVAGEATLYGSPLAGAAVMGIGNSVINQGYVNGWDKIDGVTVCNDLAMSMAMSCVGASMGNAFAEPLKRLTSHITNQIVKETFVGSLSGAASGCVLGIAFELSKKDADWESVLRGGWNGCWQGWALGTIDGLGSGFQHRAVQNSKVKLQEVNPRITFGQNENQTYHTFRHIDELHLNRESVKSHVMKDLKTLDVPQGLPVNRIIYVDGIKLQYTVFKLDNGTQNVGRIHAVK